MFTLLYIFYKAFVGLIELIWYIGAFFENFVFNKKEKIIENDTNFLNPCKKNSNRINFDFLQNSTFCKNNNIGIALKISEFYLKYKINLQYIKEVEGFSSVSIFYKIITKSKIKQIKNLVNDLQLFVKMSNIEILENIEEGTIVFQIPKNKNKILSLKDVATSEKKGLTVGLGLTPTNEKIKIDITQTPHLLTAGATGSRQVGIFE